MTVANLKIKFFRNTIKSQLSKMQIDNDSNMLPDFSESNTQLEIINRDEIPLIDQVSTRLSLITL